MDWPLDDLSGRGRIRTHETRLRRPVQYPAMRRAHRLLRFHIQGGSGGAKRHADDLVLLLLTWSDAKR